jgi:hypothetical protein
MSAGSSHAGNLRKFSADFGSRVSELREGDEFKEMRKLGEFTGTQGPRNHATTARNEEAQSPPITLSKCSKPLDAPRANSGRGSARK